MTENVIELQNFRPHSDHQALHHAGPQPKFQVKWTSESGEPQSKTSSDREVIRRQLESCRQRRRPAIVKRFEDANDTRGKPCGGVHAITDSRGRRVWQAHFEELSWE